MKQRKNILTSILTFVMIFVLSVPAKAAGTDKITINNPDEDYTYEAYQIFTGDLSDAGVLSNIVWGSGVKEAIKETGSGYAAASDEAVALTDAAAADAFAKRLVDDKMLAAGIAGTRVGETYVIEGLEPGYYLVRNTAVPGEMGVHTNYIMQVVGEVTVDPKSAAPSSDKEVKEVNDTDGTFVWQKNADHDIGDMVEFRLTATLPSNYSTFKQYYLAFNDTLSKGFTFSEATADFVVQRGDDTLTGYTVNFDAETNSFVLAFNDLKALDNVTFNNNDKITVTYKAKLNENAVIGGTGNPNTSYLTFSNNPNHEGEGDTTSKTPVDTVVVFTFKTIVNKVEPAESAGGDAAYTPLAGAEFELYKKIKGSWERVQDKLTMNTEGTSFTFTGLDAGSYKLKESVTPAGYNTIADIEFDIVPVYGNDTQTGALKVTNLNEGDGVFVPNVDDGSLTTQVVNKMGSVLPSTGGIGKTIFYVVGGVLMAAAFVFLVASKRKDSKN